MAIALPAPPGPAEAPLLRAPPASGEVQLATGVARLRLTAPPARGEAPLHPRLLLPAPAAIGEGAGSAGCFRTKVPELSFGDELFSTVIDQIYKKRPFKF